MLLRDEAVAGQIRATLQRVEQAAVNVEHASSQADALILLFEPTRNGGIRITGADFIVFKTEWDNKHKGEGPPSLNGQLFHLFDAPNRFGLDPLYTLHVWAWKQNPNGTFTNWNPNVSCDAFNPKTLND